MFDRIFQSPWNEGIETSAVLVLLIALEAVLSADNAIALAAIAQGLKDEKQREQALNLGLVVAYILRMALILTASWVNDYWQFQLLGAAYLLWLVYKHFSKTIAAEEEGKDEAEFTSLWQVIPIIGITDLAFSLDSVTTATAVSEKTWLVLVGGTIGVITLRFLAGLFIRWLDEYTYLENAGYATVGLVGLRLATRALQPSLVPPEWIMIGAIALIFAWGFSKKVVSENSDGVQK
jgi:YkoY family integral membrane protein